MSCSICQENIMFVDDWDQKSYRYQYLIVFLVSFPINEKFLLLRQKSSVEVKFFSGQVLHAKTFFTPSF